MAMEIFIEIGSCNHEISWKEKTEERKKNKLELKLVTRWQVRWYAVNVLRLIILQWLHITTEYICDNKSKQWHITL